MKTSYIIRPQSVTQLSFGHLVTPLEHSEKELHMSATENQLKCSWRNTVEAHREHAREKLRSTAARPRVQDAAFAPKRAITALSRPGRLITGVIVTLESCISRNKATYLKPFSNSCGNCLPVGDDRSLILMRFLIDEIIIWNDLKWDNGVLR